MSCVLFTEHPTQSGHKILEITLNAERSLHALSLEMIELMQPALEQAQQDDKTLAVVLNSTGEKAFCAGGDVVGLYRAIVAGDDLEAPTNFFTREYTLDYTIHTFTKPIICWGSGIVIGGGMGIMNGCSHRVVTQTTHMAMPEVTIGLYPDVAGSWFLNRMPGRTGLFLGLTGNPIYAADALYLGLADRFVDAAKQPELIEKLKAADWSSNSHMTVTAILREMEQASQAVYRTDSPIQDHFQFIQQITDKDSVAEIVAAMAEIESDDPWIARSKKAIGHGSPLSIVLIAEQLKRCRHLSLKEVFKAELTLSVQCCMSGEFAEGVRALLVDKDGSPNWRYSSVSEVPTEAVAAHFVEPWGNHPLANL